MPSPKKLIEVVLPLEAINVASAREKSIRHGRQRCFYDGCEPDFGVTSVNYSMDALVAAATERGVS